MTINQAITDLFSQRLWYKPLGISKNLANRYKERLKHGQLSLNKQKEILLKAKIDISKLTL